MVSKTVVLALVALCCAAVFAAPSEERRLGNNILDCMKPLKDGLQLVKDGRGVYKAYKKIFADASAERKACATVEGATAEAISACQQAATDKEQDALIAETTSAVTKVLPEIVKVVKEVKDCLD